MPSNMLFADLYQFTMLRAYFELGMASPSAFSLFVRRLPSRRNFLIACGLADLLKEMETLRFDEEQLSYLRSLGEFPDSFLKWLREFRFTGDIYALPEGTPFFANEPILEVVAPIAQAQVIETLVLNQIGLQSILASKAARIVTAARGRPVVDFGARRAQGIDAATMGARAFYIGGVTATSNLAAGKAYGIPVSGTMAHSFIEACASEAEAFDSFARIFPETTLLVDTYDTLAGVAKVVALSHSLGPKFKVRAIRLDSGDLDQLARGARQILDDAGLTNVQIIASGGLDEDQIDRLTTRNAPIDIFGVGTNMAVSSDAPALDIAYKLVEYAGVGRMKFSAGKTTLPGRKQIFRNYHRQAAVYDVIGRHDEDLPGLPLLSPVMLSGRRVGDGAGDLDLMRSYTKEAIETLPLDHRSLAPPVTPYDIRISSKLAEYQQSVVGRLLRTSKDRERK